MRINQNDSPLIANFHQISPWFYRGGQPDEKALEMLRDMGVKTVISFRWKRKLLDWESEICKRLGLNFIAMPLTYTVLPSESMVKEFVSVLEAEENHPVFIHCLHGKDRTGLMMAIYRITSEGWSFEDAYREMKAYGFRHIRIRPFKWKLQRYYREHLVKLKDRDSQQNEGSEQ